MVGSLQTKIAPITLSDDGGRFIGAFEGTSLKAYRDGGGLPTIGTGHRIPSMDTYPNGITMAQAIAFLHDDVRETIQGLMAIKLNLPFQYQEDAVISLTFNIGVGAFRRSIICEALLAHATDLYAWAAWTRDAKGVIEPGLVRRREAEMKLFIYGEYS
jgi:lysozyme